MEEVEKPKKQRTEKQKAATAKALEALKARRQIARDVINEDMNKQVEEVEERIVAKVMSRMGVIKPEHEEEEEVKKVVKKAIKPTKKVVVIEEEESSSEEEVVIKKVKKEKPATQTAPEPVRKTTGNKLLDKMYGFI